MSPSIRRLTPTAIVAALVVWCCWPYLNGPPGELDLGSGDLPLIAASRLSPEMQPVSSRDPFEYVGRDRTDGVEGEAAPAQQRNGPATIEEEPEVPVADRLRKLALGATFIHGSRRIALIDGHLYEPGDVLPVSHVAADSCIVAWISADKVLVQHPDGTVELTYRGCDSGRVASGE